MARTTGRSGFKMKSGNSPLRQGPLGTSSGTSNEANTKENILNNRINSFFGNLKTRLATERNRDTSGDTLQKLAKKVSDYQTKRKKKAAEKAKASSDGLTNFQRRQAERNAQRENPGMSMSQIKAEKARKDRKQKRKEKRDLTSGRGPELTAEEIADNQRVERIDKKIGETERIETEKQIAQAEADTKLKQFQKKNKAAITNPNYEDDKDNHNMINNTNLAEKDQKIYNARTGKYESYTGELLSPITKKKKKNKKSPARNYKKGYYGVK